MTKTARRSLALALTMGVAAALAVTGPAMAGGRPLAVPLSGAQEVTGTTPSNPHGDADNGSVSLTLNHGQGEVCFEFGALTLTAGESLPTAGHIHTAPAGVSGLVVVPLFTTPAAAPTGYPTAEQCVSADRALIKAIIQHPEEYYVNLHNSTHPSGVVRGQLSK